MDQFGAGLERHPGSPLQAGIGLIGEDLPAPGDAETRGLRTIPGEWMAAGACAGFAALCLLMHRAQLTVDVRGGAFATFAALFSLAAYGCWHLRRPASDRQAMARNALEFYGLFVFVCLAGALASYPVAGLSHGFADAALARIDRALGFDWNRWYAFDIRHPWIERAQFAAYQAIYLSPAVVLGAFVLQRRVAEARAFIACFALGALLTLVAFRAMPALGPLAYQWQGPMPFMPASALWQAELIPQLRDHAITAIDLGSLRGLVGAPSFHTTSALLYIAFGWRVREVRWPIVAINLAMLVATPVEGNHYLTDMVAGALVAALALAGVLLTAKAPSDLGTEQDMPLNHSYNLGQT